MVGLFSFTIFLIIVLIVLAKFTTLGITLYKESKIPIIFTIESKYSDGHYDNAYRCVGVQKGEEVWASEWYKNKNILLSIIEGIAKDKDKVYDEHGEIVVFNNQNEV